MSLLSISKMEEPTKNCCDEVIIKEESLELFFGEDPFDCDKDASLSSSFTGFDGVGVHDPSEPSDDEDKNAITSRDVCGDSLLSNRIKGNASENLFDGPLPIPTSFVDCGSFRANSPISRIRCERSDRDDDGDDDSMDKHSKRMRYDRNSEEGDSDSSSHDDGESQSAPAPVNPKLKDTPTWTTTPCMHELASKVERKILVQFPGNNKPIDWFTLLLDDFFYNIVKYTNEVGRTQTRGRWTDVDTAELKLFIGILMHTGTVKCNHLKDYWNTDPMFGTQYIRGKMSQERFLALLKALSFSTENPMAQAKSLIRRFNAVMTKVYYPDKDLVVDDGILVWKGLTYLVKSDEQIDTNKTSDTGFKIYSLYETGGPIVSMACSQSLFRCSYLIEMHELDIIKQLMADKQSGHSLRVSSDHFGLTMAKSLLEDETYSTGYVREDSVGVPGVLKQTYLEEGATSAVYADGVMFGKKRRRQRDWYYMSTEYENTMVVTTDKDGGQETPLPLMKLKYSYSRHMVEVTRPLVDYYPTFRILHLQWHKKTFLYLLQVMMLNAHKLYNLSRQTSGIPCVMEFHFFRLQVIRELIDTKTDGVVQRWQCAAVLEDKKDGLRHEIDKINTRSNNGRVRRRRCKMCSIEHKVKQTTFLCRQCPDQPALCPIRCFDKYHRSLERSGGGANQQ